VQEVAEQIHSKVHALFNYKDDKSSYDVVEDWRSHVDAVEKGERFTDDCDGFAITCSELLAKAGVPVDKISLILCRTETGGMHLVCGLDTDDTTLILDNRQRSVWDYGQLDYTWIKRVTADDPQHWKGIV
jgi:predicted transglutaminase-like cysteine proteinase